MGNMTLHAEGTPVCSFQSSAKVPIESLKAYFAPKQEGSGDPSPSNVRPISGWTGLNVYEDDVYIPVEYQRVEYLESSASSNNQPYINTNIIPNNNMRIVVKGRILNNIVSAGFIFGSCISVSNEPFWGIVWKNKYKYGLGNKQNIDIVNASINQDFVFDFNNNASYRMTVNDESVTGAVVSSSQTYTYPIFIFAVNTNGSHDYQVTPVRIKQFTVYNSYSDTTPSMNLIPCLRKLDSKPGMYDTVSGNFYTNSGTGEFLYGANVGTAIPVTFPVLGKNKFDYANANIIDQRRRDDNGNEVYDGTGSYSSLLTPVLPSTTYTASGFGSDQSKRIYYIDADENFILRTDIIGTNTFTFTTPANCYFVQFQSGRISSSTWSDVQLELGDTATTYTPYDPDNTVYGGYVDLIGGEIVQFYDKIVFTEDMIDSILINGTKNATISLSGSYNIPSTSSGFRPLQKVNCYQNGTAIQTSITFLAGTNGTFYIVLGSTPLTNFGYSLIETDVAKFIHDMETNGTPLTIVYPLATSIHHPIVPAQLKTLLGHNAIWSNANNTIRIDYAIHDSAPIRAAKRRIAANTPHIETVTNSVATFNTDMRAPLRECKAYFSPKQDLHGYSNPWPAGGGKNIAKPYDNSYVSSTYVSFDYSAANGTFRCYGTASPSSTHSSPSATNAVNNGATFTLPAGTYTLSIIDGDGANIYAQCVSSTETVLAETTSYTTFTTNESLTVFVRLKVAAAATVDKTVKIQLEAGSTATSYVPYENICSISGWSGLTVTKCGKNLIDESYLANANSYVNAGGYGYYYTDDIQLVPNTHYRFVWYDYDNTALSELETTTIHLYVLGASEYIVHNADYRQYPLGFITPATGIIRFGIYCPSSLQRQNVLDAIFNNGKLLLQVGTDDVAYEPYNGTTLPINWTTEAGTVYGGYVDLVTGEVWKTWDIVKPKDYTWSRYTNYQFYLTLTKRDKTSTEVISDTFSISKTNTYPTINKTIGFYSGGQAYANIIFIKYEDSDNTNDFNAWLQNLENEPVIAYKLAVPELVATLTPTQLKSLVGVNNIWSNADEVKISYWSH